MFYDRVITATTTQIPLPINAAVCNEHRSACTTFSFATCPQERCSHKRQPGVLELIIPRGGNQPCLVCGLDAPAGTAGVTSLPLRVRSQEPMGFDKHAFAPPLCRAAVSTDDRNLFPRVGNVDVETFGACRIPSVWHELLRVMCKGLTGPYSTVGDHFG